MVAWPMAQASWSPRSSLEKLQAWAEANECRVQRGAPLTSEAIDALAASIRPHFGTTTFVAPPSYRAFLAACGSLKVEARLDGDWESVRELQIYSPEAAARITADTVHVPAGVDFGDGRAISTNHLVGFAGTRYSPDCTLCFDTSHADATGEYPVVFHDQDEPLHAVHVDDGTRSAEKVIEPTAPGFGAWFDQAVAELVKKSHGDLDI